MPSSSLTWAEIAQMMRDPVKDQTYRQTPVGGMVGRYVRWLRNEFGATPSTVRDYEAILARMSLALADKEILDVTTDDLRIIIDELWATRSPRTRQKVTSVLRAFWQWVEDQDLILRSPAARIRRPRAGQVERTTFSSNDRDTLLAAAESRRDRIAIRLLFDYGLRKGSLQAIQFKHFDHQRRRLGVFAKGGKVRAVPLPDPHLWLDLERHILDVEAEPNHYLMARVTGNAAKLATDPTQPMAAHGLHKWWYRRLVAGGLVPTGTTSGERMHKARHTAGQNVLDKTGNLKAVQSLLGHSSIQTTADVYTDWDIDQLAATMADVLREDAADGL